MSWDTTTMVSPSLLVERREKLEYLSLELDVEEGRWFVKEQDLGLLRKGPRDQHPLSFRLPRAHGWTVRPSPGHS